MTNEERIAKLEEQIYILIKDQVRLAKIEDQYLQLLKAEAKMEHMVEDVTFLKSDVAQLRAPAALPGGMAKHIDEHLKNRATNTWVIGIGAACVGGLLAFLGTALRADATATAFTKSVDTIVAASADVATKKGEAEIARQDAVAAKKKAEDAATDALVASAQLRDILGGDSTKKIAEQLLSDESYRGKLADAVAKVAANDISDVRTQLKSLNEHRVIAFLKTKAAVARIDEQSGVRDGRHLEYLSIPDLHIGGWMSVNRTLTCNKVECGSVEQEPLKKTIRMLDGNAPGG